MEHMEYEYWFAGVKKLSAKKKQKMRTCCQIAKAIYYIEETALSDMDFLNEKDIELIKQAQKEENLKEKYERAVKAGIEFIPYFHPQYPERLKKIPDAPYALYVKGRLPQEERISAAIVGARRCTPYGETLALEYGKVLAAAGVQIISGLAKGIDGAGHRGAIDGGGTTFAVLGCGVDVCYPREHIGLYMDIQKHGGLLSEQCPGDAPLSYYFPLRNRIISALSDIILVMEAKEKSGSLITADTALEQGKDVYALPGPVTSALSQGCHSLIKQGAGILLSPEDLLEELYLLSKDYRENSDKNQKVLETPENLVYSCFDLFPKGIDTLMKETGMSPEEVLEALVTLEIDGYIEEVSKNYYIKARK